MATSSDYQALAGIVAGIVGVPCDTYTSATALGDIVILPNGAVWISPTVTLAYVQLDGMGSHGIPTVVTLHTSMGTVASGEGDADAYRAIADRILSAIHAVLLYA